MITQDGRRTARQLLGRKPEVVAVLCAANRGKGAPQRCRLLRNGLSREQRWEIIDAYTRTLDKMRTSIGSEADLPYQKDLIRLAIYQELVENPDTDLNNLEIAYVQLECFISHEEYMVIADFKDASRLAQEMAELGDPTSLIRSAMVMKQVKGDQAVSIQEKVSERMRERLVQIQEIGTARSGNRDIGGNDSVFI